jgi:hypothetical protein
LGQLGGMTYLAMAASTRGATALASVKAFPANFVGWRESAVMAGRLAKDDTTVLVADNFMLAAELEFERGAPSVYALDSPLNVKHGRAPQLAIWQLDEAGLRASHAGSPVLLAVDETALRVRERAAWLGQVCSRIAELRPLLRLEPFHGRKQIAFYAGRVPAEGEVLSGDPANCVVLRQALGRW